MKQASTRTDNNATIAIVAFAFTLAIAMLVEFAHASGAAIRDDDSAAAMAATGGDIISVGLHAQASFSSSGFVVGSEITCRGLQSALEKHPRVQSPVPIMFPIRHKEIWRRKFDLFIVEGWFPGIGPWLHELRRQSNNVLIFFYALDPGFPGTATLVKLDVDGFLMNSVRMRARLAAAGFPSRYVPLAVDPEAFSLANATTTGTKYGAVYVGAYVPEAQKRTLFWLLRAAAGAALNATAGSPTDDGDGRDGSDTVVPFAIFGYGWEAAPEDLRRHWRGVLPRDALGPTYGASAVVLCSTANEQRSDGMVNNRVFEALASGAVVVSDWFAELEDTFADLVRYARTPDDAARHVRAALDAHNSDTGDSSGGSSGSDNGDGNGNGNGNVVGDGDVATGERARRAAQHDVVRKHHTWAARVRGILALRDELVARRRVRPARPRLLIVHDAAAAYDLAFFGALDALAAGGDYAVTRVDADAVGEDAVSRQLQPAAGRRSNRPNRDHRDPCAPYAYDVLVVSAAWRSPLVQLVRRSLAPFERRPLPAAAAVEAGAGTDAGSHPHLRGVRADACHAARPRKALLLAPGSAPSKGEGVAGPAFFDLIYYRTAWQLGLLVRFVVSAGAIRQESLQQVTGVSIAAATEAITEVRKLGRGVANATWFDFSYVGPFAKEDRLHRLAAHPPRTATRAAMHLGPPVQGGHAGGAFCGTAAHSADGDTAAALARGGTVVVRAPRTRPELVRRTAHRILGRTRTVVLPSTERGGGAWLIQAWLAHVQQGKALKAQLEAGTILNLSLENDNTKLVTHANLGVLDIPHVTADFRKGLSRALTFGRAGAAVDVYIDADRWRARRLDTSRPDLGPAPRRAHIAVPGNVTLRPLFRLTDFAVGEDGYYCLNVYSRDPAAATGVGVAAPTIFSLCLMDDRSHLALFFDSTSVESALLPPSSVQPAAMEEKTRPANTGRVLFLQVELKNAVFNDTTAKSNVVPICVLPPDPSSSTCVGDWCAALDATPHMARQLRDGLAARATKQKRNQRVGNLTRDTGTGNGATEKTAGVKGLVATLVNETLAHVGFRERVLVYAVTVAPREQQQFVSCTGEGLFNGGS